MTDENAHMVAVLPAPADATPPEAAPTASQARSAGDDAAGHAGLVGTGVLKVCERCGETYDWRKSASRYLKMTYCSAMDEARDGCTIEDLLRAERDPVKGQVAAAMRFLSEHEKPPRVTYADLFRWMKETGL